MFLYLAVPNFVLYSLKPILILYISIKIKYFNLFNFANMMLINKYLFTNNF